MMVAVVVANLYIFDFDELELAYFVVVYWNHTRLEINEMQLKVVDFGYCLNILKSGEDDDVEDDDSVGYFGVVFYYLSQIDLSRLRFVL